MEKVCLGKVVKLHGYMGQMKVRTMYDKDFKIKNIDKIYDENDNEFNVTKIFQTKDGVVVALEGVNLEKANTYIGTDLYIDRNLLQDKILIEDLKGATVVFEDGREIGKILDVNDYGAAEVFSVKNEKGKEIMFPNVKGLIVKFDLAEKKLILNEQRFKEVSDEN
ncbi:MAG: 16S rRNA processing protein RimM [Clostridia bacterium]|nr:16S rRNA processing protein RimM [Clostridia bacterium]